MLTLPALCLLAAPLGAGGKLVLEPPAGSPFQRGARVLVGLDLEIDAPSLRYVVFGVRAGPGGDVLYIPAEELLAVPDFAYYNDRYVDVGQDSVGLGNFGLDDPRLLLPVTGGKLRLGSIRIDIDPEAALGDLELSVGECVCSATGGLIRPVADLGPDAAQVDLAPATLAITVGNHAFVRGDANRDGRLDVSDPAAVVAQAFLGTQFTTCPKASDANDDGSVDVSDAIYLFSYLFLGGPAPPPPFPLPGSDPTPDPLTCGPPP